MQVPVGLIIRARTKSFKDALNGLIHYIRVDSNMLQFRMGPKQDNEGKFFNLSILAC